MKTCVIFGAGDRPEKLPDLPENAFFIASDGGYLTMRAFGIQPDLFVGDGDSLPGGLPEDVPAVKLPVVKDVTDTDAAVAEGFKRGCDDFLLLGCMGGRLDHTFANVTLLARLSKKGCKAKMTDGKTAIEAVTDGSLSLPARKSGTVAVFAFSDVCDGVTIRGLQYELTDGRLTADFALGVSNAYSGKAAEISVKKGTLIVVYDEGNCA